jgi:hypothetical protein
MNATPFMAPLTEGATQRLLLEAECELATAQDLDDQAWADEARAQVEFYEDLLRRLQVPRCARCQRRLETRMEVAGRCCNGCFQELFKSTRSAPTVRELAKVAAERRRSQPTMTQRLLFGS